MSFRVGFVSIAFGLAASLVSAQEPVVPVDPMVAMEQMPAMDHWMTMVHGWAYLTYNDQGGPSGGDQFGSQNHFMGMATRSFLGGKLSFYGTLSLEPATIPEPGSRELFQVGETFTGVLLVDYQHPHDFFMQLAGAWEKTFAPGSSLRFYAAAVGEPALGPPGLRSPPLRLGEPDRAAFPPQPGLDAHLLRRADTGSEGLDLHARGLGLPRRGARREPLGHRGGADRLLRRAAHGGSAPRADRAGLRRAPHESGGGRAREPESVHRHARLREGVFARVPRRLAHHGSEPGERGGDAVLGNASRVDVEVRRLQHDLRSLRGRGSRSLRAEVQASASRGDPARPHARLRRDARLRARLHAAAQRHDGHRRGRDALPIHGSARRRLLDESPSRSTSSRGSGSTSAWEADTRATRRTEAGRHGARVREDRRLRAAQSFKMA